MVHTPAKIWSNYFMGFPKRLVFLPHLWCLIYSTSNTWNAGWSSAKMVKVLNPCAFLTPIELKYLNKKSLHLCRIRHPNGGKSSSGLRIRLPIKKGMTCSLDLDILDGLPRFFQCLYVWQNDLMRNKKICGATNNKMRNGALFLRYFHWL